MNLKTAIIYPDWQTYGEHNLNYQEFISWSSISILTMETLLNWNEIMRLRRN